MQPDWLKTWTDFKQFFNNVEGARRTLILYYYSNIQMKTVTTISKLYNFCASGSSVFV